MTQLIGLWNEKMLVLFRVSWDENPFLAIHFFRRIVCGEGNRLVDGKKILIKQQNLDYSRIFPSEFKLAAT